MVCSSYYLHNWMAMTDYTLWSPQVESMNRVFALDEEYPMRPKFWFELSTWTAISRREANDKRRFSRAGRDSPSTPELTRVCGSRLLAYLGPARSGIPRLAGDRQVRGPILVDREDRGPHLRQPGLAEVLV